MRTILLTGVPGVGKTTVAEWARARAGVSSTSWAEAMRAILVKQGEAGVELADLARDLRRDIQRQAAESIGEHFDIVEGQLTTVDSRGYFPLPPDVLAPLRVRMIVALDAPPGQVYDRRLHDAIRRRPVATVAEIAAHARANLSNALGLGRTLGIPVIVLANLDGQLERTAAALVQFVDERFDRYQGWRDGLPAP